jgi:hypothetical protein
LREAAAGDLAQGFQLLRKCNAFMAASLPGIIGKGFWLRLSRHNRGAF